MSGRDDLADRLADVESGFPDEAWARDRRVRYRLDSGPAPEPPPVLDARNYPVHVRGAVTGQPRRRTRGRTLTGSRMWQVAAGALDL